MVHLTAILHETPSRPSLLSSPWFLRLIPDSTFSVFFFFLIFVKESLGIDYFIYLFLAFSKAREFLVPQPGIEPAPPASEARSLNQCTTRESPFTSSFCIGAGLEVIRVVETTVLLYLN